MIKWARRILVVLGGLYLCYALAMIWLHPRFIYPFSDQVFDDTGYETISISVADTEPAILFVSQGAPDKPLILYFMGNLGAAEIYRAMLDHHANRGRGVAIMGYRGGGGLPGAPSERALKRDALAAFDALQDSFPDRKIVVQGFSLGTGLAVHVSVRRNPDAMILSAPYARICMLMARASFLPACRLPVQRWETVEDAVDARPEALVLHGTQDQVIPVAQGQKVAEALPNGRMITVPGAGHNNLMQFPAYLTALDGFLDAL